MATAEWRLQPIDEDERRFWTLIDQAWEGQGSEPQILRRWLTDRRLTIDDVPLYEIDRWLPGFLDTCSTTDAD